MTAKILEIEDLTVNFDGFKALNQLNFSMDAGELRVIIGPNGAGKTTFINMVTGYIKPTTGQINFDGKDITGLSPRKIVEHGIGRTFQLPQLFLEQTVKESLELAVAARSGQMRMFKPLAECVESTEIEAMLEIVGLSARANDLCSSLPEGHRKLLDIAMALVLRPKLIIMDEPTSGVASNEKHPLMATIMRALDEQNVTAMFVEHDVDIVKEYATRVTAWISGRITADGLPSDVLSNEEVRTVILGH
jgi:branched-chain amino acid transport system ATP-binding protein